jgi:hemerythrin-like domain-containing protein/ferredoxin
MKAVVDRAACIGCGICEATCPEVFSMDNEGFASVIAGEIPAAIEASATEAMEGCPTGAIFIYASSDEDASAPKDKAKVASTPLRAEVTASTVIASANLIEEHDGILFGLKILEEMVFLKGNLEEVDAGDFAEMIDFLMIFADKCHQGKEEDIYFPALEEAGIKKQEGPIAKLLMDHIDGRERIFRMTELAKDFSSNENEYMAIATDLIRMLREHIETENTTLYPLGDAVVPADVQKKMIAEFEKFEETVMGKGTHEKQHELLHRLEKKYLQKT